MKRLPVSNSPTNIITKNNLSKTIISKRVISKEKEYKKRLNLLHDWIESENRVDREDLMRAVLVSAIQYYYSRCDNNILASLVNHTKICISESSEVFASTSIPSHLHPKFIIAPPFPDHNENFIDLHFTMYDNISDKIKVLTDNRMSVKTFVRSIKEIYLIAYMPIDIFPKNISEINVNMIEFDNEFKLFIEAIKALVKTRHLIR